MSSGRFPRFRLLAAVLAGPSIAFAAPPFGVGDLWIAGSGSGEILQTQVFQSPGELSASARLYYEIGFSTQERVDLGALFDSITITLARANGADAANLVTGDVFGLTAAQQGGLLPDGSITFQQIAPRISLMDDAATAFAYSVEVSLPAALVGNEFRTTFSFFNNGDNVPSRGYAILVPEPSTHALMALAGIMGAIYWRRARRSRA